MGYNKLIAYGNYVELYEYEKNLGERIVKNERNNDGGIRRQDLAVNGEVISQQSEQKYNKRADNARRTTMAFRRLVASNLGVSGNPLLITFTYAENIADIRQGYKDFQSYIERMRTKYGSSFRYISVPEFQARGAVHFHSLFWGLPVTLFSEERKNRVVASLWSHGFVFIKETDGDDRLSTYLSKYMSKAFTDPRLKNQKAYTCSRNVIRPVVSKGFSPSWPVIEDWGLSTAPICKEVFFSTKWLGKGRFRLFKLI